MRPPRILLKYLNMPHFFKAFLITLILFLQTFSFAQKLSCDELLSLQATSSDTAFISLLVEIRNGLGVVKPMTAEEQNIAVGIINNFALHRGTDISVQETVEKLMIEIIFQSAHLEETYKLINELGLRHKFYNSKDITENGPRIKSVWWWLNKVPLPTRPLGTSGRTATEIGLYKVSHNTHNIETIHSITRSKDRSPNVFKSRFAYPGETAMHGDGFYTKIGDSGAGGSGYTVSFEVDPMAREGEDFKIIGGEYVVFFNRAALLLLTSP